MIQRAEFDAVIVGAGPSGSSLAIRLSLAGRKVLLIDKDQFPRHKLCGEFVSPECLDHLNELGVAPNLEKISPPAIAKTVFYSSGGRSFTVANKWLAEHDRESIGTSRRSLDQLLVDRAAECGAEIMMGTSVNDARVKSEQQITVCLRSAEESNHEVSTSLLIDGTGRGRYIARKFDRIRNAAKPAQVAFKAHLRGAKIDRDACEIFSYPGGYGGCAEVEGGLYNLCFVVESGMVRSIGSDPLRIFENTILKNKRAAKVLADFDLVGDWLSVPIARYGSLDPSPAPGILAVGDAAAFIDPFTGSGIAMALQSSRLASNAITSFDESVTIAEEYRRSHAVTFERRLRFCRALRFLSTSPNLANAAIATLATSKLLRRSFARLTRSAPQTG